MASTNKTANLGLNQWVLSDPLLMEDMNSDNQKIDAAVAEQTYKKLISITTAANAQQIDFDLSGIDLSKYASLRIEACYGCTPADTISSLYVRINNISTQSYFRPSDGSNSAGFTSVLFAPIASYTVGIPASFSASISGISGAPNSQATYKALHGELSYYGYLSGTPYIGQKSASITLEKTVAISSINILACNTSGYIQAGSEFVLYGVKK
ncbi:MAG: hypothetical protein KBI01_08170 [Oscillospiraceae bacterium]|nr:hypothetical protein [Oscillospiraceae bacterium]